MVRSAVVAIVALMVGTAAGWYLREAELKPVKPGHAYSFTDRLDAPHLKFLAATGTWIADNLASKANTVQILCDPANETCDVIQADVTKLVSLPSLYLDKATYPITKIDAQALVAEKKPGAGCVRVTLLFDRIAKRVSFVRTKIKNEPPCSIVDEEPLTMYLGDPK